MKHYLITRTYEDNGTYGKMGREDGTYVAYTCERSKNDPDYPCIPEGT